MPSFTAYRCLETLRKWLIEAGVWQTRTERRKRPQPPRTRRECFGELVQIDGCDHDWFEDRGPRCTLLVYVDDATSSLMELRFVQSESTFDYFASTERYLKRFGRPVAFYSDKLSVFRVTAKEAVAGVGYTQFGRAMRDLNIDVICANTPAAKGRVERAHQTLQDRLVKELQLRGISDQDAGNAYLDEFREDYNRRFARAAKNPRDAHRPLLPSDDLRRTLTWQEQRRLTNNLTLHYKRVLYVIDATPAADRARGRRVDVRENEDGSIQIEYLGAELTARAFAKDAHVNPGAIVENKLLGHTLRIIADAQRERDESRLENQRMTLREQDKLRRAMAAAFDCASHEPKYRVNKPPTYSAMRLALTMPTDELQSRPPVEPLEPEKTVRGKKARSRKAPFIGPKRPVGRPPKPKPITPAPPARKRARGAIELNYADLPPIAIADPNPLARVLAWAKSQTGQKP